MRANIARSWPAMLLAVLLMTVGCGSDEQEAASSSTTTVEVVVSELEQAVELCAPQSHLPSRVRSGLDGSGNWSASARTTTLDDGWACLVRELAGDAALDMLLSASDVSGPVTVELNGYVFSLDFSGTTSTVTLSILNQG